MSKFSKADAVKVLGIDLAKDVFHLHGVDAHGRVVLRKRLQRRDLAAFVANLSPCLIGMEACSGAHSWARKFREMGHEVRLMNPQFVRPYVKSNKNDAADAEAICEAVQRPSMRFVPIKSVEQQDEFASCTGDGHWASHGVDQPDSGLAARVWGCHGPGIGAIAQGVAGNFGGCGQWLESDVSGAVGRAVSGAAAFGCAHCGV